MDHASITAVGIDTGGTFTDFVLLTPAGIRTHKCLSTPDAPERAVLQGLAELGVGPGLRVVHGSTVATNAVLEGKGVRTVYIANRGLGDVLTIGRQARRELYDLQPQPVQAPVPPALCLETGGRLAADGSVIEPLTESDLAALTARVRALEPRAAAINLLFSFRDPSLEQAIAAALPPGVFVSCSSSVLPEYREYERGIATWLNAAVGPLMQDYLRRLTAALPDVPVAVMHSAGGTLSAAQAGGQAVRLLLSGPAAGLAGARFAGRLAGTERLLTFDMGGTSTDVALLDGGIRLTSEGEIGGYPVAIPMVDMHTIGAGGGSIARVDRGGLLQVGPQSAGAEPGPACYGRGGTEATVTDANVVLGRLGGAALAGGSIPLDAAAARRAVAAVARRLGVEPAAAAAGIVRLANEHMAGALRVISVQRGIDPRGHTLMSFGGAGGLHVCALAAALGMPRAMVPVHAGVLSALGMLAAPRNRHLSQTVAAPLPELAAADLESAFTALAARGRDELAAEGVDPRQLSTECSVDLRYRGQSYTLNLPWSEADAVQQAFHAAHERRYGHRLRRTVECVNVRVAVQAPAPSLALPRAPGGALAAAAAGTAALHAIDDPVPVYARDRMPVGATFAGPALVAEDLATTYVEPGWTCRVDGYGNLLLELGRP